MFSLCLSVSYIISAFGILGGMVASLYPSWESEALGNEQFPRLLELKIRGDGAHNNSIWCQSSHSFSHVPCLSFTILHFRTSERHSWVSEWRSIWGFCWEALLLHQDGWLVPYSEALLGSPSSLWMPSTQAGWDRILSSHISPALGTLKDALSTPLPVAHIQLLGCDFFPWLCRVP